MRQTLIAATVAALPLAAAAQSNVTLYGRLDMSVNQLNFSSTATKPSSTLRTVTSDTSMFGLRGSEDLGGGLRAYFKMESGFNADTGAQAGASTFWNRESYVGVGSSSLGSVQFGAHYSPVIFQSARTDPFYRFHLGSHANLLQGLRGYALQYGNTVQYITPNVGGVTAKLLVALGEGAATGKAYAANLEYASGPAYAALNIDQSKTTAASVGPTGDPVTSRTIALSGAYDFKLVKLHGWVQTNHIDKLDHVNGWMLGATVPVGQAGDIRASYQQRSQTNADAKLLAVGYFHHLSKRTLLYTVAGRLDNSSGASYVMGPMRGESAALGVPAAGQDVTGVQVGMRHLF